MIFLIVYIFNFNFYYTLAYLQTACIVIVLIHIWFQPYQSDLLNALDGVMLVFMIQGASDGMTDDTSFLIGTVMVVVFPLILFSTIIIRKVIYSCSKNHINNVDIHDVVAEENIILRYIATYVHSYS